MRNYSQGFTLIELMIVVAIIGILSGIAIPAYRNYMIDTAEDACLAEAAGYARMAFSNIQLERAVQDPVKKACLTLDSAASMTVSTLGTLNATPNLPGQAPISCNLATGATCKKN